MDSSPVLRQQSRNKVHSYFQRVSYEHNKKRVDSKPSKVLPASHLSNTDEENQDPGKSQTAKKPLGHASISRLPVLAKSLHLQTSSDFSQSHCKWEAKPLAGKAKKKKPCTRPVPFNFSQPKSSKMATEGQQLLTVPQSKLSSANKVPSLKPTKHQASLNSNGNIKPHGRTTENTSHLSGQTGPSKIFKTTATSNPPDNTLSQKSEMSSADACLDEMNLLCLKDPSDTSETTQGSIKGNPSDVLSNKVGNFQPDHTALLSILLNKGVDVTSVPSKPYSDLPQRVSVMKSQQKAGSLKGSLKSVAFSRDSAALQSILQNEGVKAGGPVGATPRNSVCPPGRGTSVYTAQRVPVRKKCTESTAAPAGSLKSVAFSPDSAALQSIFQNEGLKAGRLVGATPRNSVCPPGGGTSANTAQRVPVRKNCAETGGGPTTSLKDTPLNRCTPQRVPNTKHQPMSAMKWHQSAQKSPYCTSASRRCKSSHQLWQGQEAVERELHFNDQDDDQSPNETKKHPETEEELPVHASAMESHGEEKLEMTKGDNEKQETVEKGQMFLSAPHRESVIFYSAGKQLFRAPHLQKPEAHHDQYGPVSPELRKGPLVYCDLLTVSIPSQINPSFQSVHRDFTAHKSRSASSVVALLRKRFPPLEELRLDDEVASYTSVSDPACSGFLPHRPSCRNPLASILNFEEATRFVPIGFNLSSEPSHLQE
ncbi:uncharacterized protein troap [Pholidichthys leucotaenia]